MTDKEFKELLDEEEERRQALKEEREHYADYSDQE